MSMTSIDHASKYAKDYQNQIFIHVECLSKNIFNEIPPFQQSK